MGATPSMSRDASRPLGLAGERPAAAVALLPMVDMAALALVVVIGLGVRPHGLTAYGIWFDEGYHIALGRMASVPAMLDPVLSHPPSDPPYLLVLRARVGVFGAGDPAGRGLIGT